MFVLTTGDQGFLNSYYADFANAHLFEPNLTTQARKSKPVPEMERLSTLYNADVGLYMLANKASTIFLKFVKACHCRSYHASIRIIIIS